LFLYREVLHREVKELGNVIWAKKPKRLPVVLTRSEVKAVLSQLSGTPWIMASLLYGSGLRLMECVRLRVKDIDFDYNQILVIEVKGEKDRVTMLPLNLKEQHYQPHINILTKIGDEKMKKLSLIVVVALLSSCTSLMMSVKDRDSANQHIIVKPGGQVAVHMPEIREELIERIKGAGWTEERFCSKLQEELISELIRRGVDAMADSSKEGHYLTIHINEFKSGSGVARALSVGPGFGDSKLEGTAILSTSEGRRELELKKRGQKSGVSEGGDQTSDNIHYIASALASKITIESKNLPQSTQK